LGPTNPTDKVDQAALGVMGRKLGEACLKEMAKLDGKYRRDECETVKNLGLCKEGVH